MNHVNPANARTLFVLLAVLAALASCGGEGGSAPLSSAGTGTLKVTAVDPDGKPLASVHMVAHAIPGDDIIGSGDSDQDGNLTFTAMPAQVLLDATHPLGAYGGDSFDVAQTGTTSVVAVIDPDAYTGGYLPAAALLPVSVAASGVNADRSELELHIAIAAPEFVPANSGEYGRRSLPTPALRMQDCAVWLDAKRVVPACVQTGDGKITVLDYAYDPGAPALPASQGTYSALLLLDQGDRAATYDPYDLRAFAAKSFTRWAHNGVPAQVAVAGLAGQGGAAFTSPLLPQLPLSAVPDTATMFSVEHIAQEDGVERLVLLAGGASPVIAALQEALSLVAVQAPASAPRAIVALLGGGDNSGLSAQQRSASIALLRQTQADTGIQVVLVAPRLYEESQESTELAELAAALHAPIIYAGFPKAWKDHGDGIYDALRLASKLLSGSPLPSVTATFRLKSGESGGFQQGSTLHGTVWVESGHCPNDCKELPLHFAVEVP